MAALIPPAFPGNVRQNDPVRGIFYLQDVHRNAAVLPLPTPCLSFGPFLYSHTHKQHLLLLAMPPPPPKKKIHPLFRGLSDRAFVNGCYLELFDSGLGKEHRRLRR